MWILGITGSISTGKSTIVKRWKETRDVSVVDADEISHRIAKRGTYGYRLLVSRFGSDILDENQEIDRRKLGRLVFQDRQLRNELNSILHPLIFVHMIFQLAWCWLTCRSYVLLEAPLLYETGLDRFTSWNVVVWCDDELQIERLKRRDGIDEVDAKSRVSSQMTQQEKKKRAHYTIDSSGSMEETMRQVDVVSNAIMTRERTILAWIVSPPGLFLCYATFRFLKNRWMSASIRADC